MTTKDEALKHLDELDKRVAEVTGSRDNLVKQLVETDRALNDALAENEQLKGEAKKLTKQAIELTTNVTNLEAKLQGYSALGKALGQIRGDGVSPDLVRQMVKEEVANLGPVVGASPGAVSTELPELIINVDRPEVVAEDVSLKGGIAILISEGFFDKARSVGNVRTRLNSIGLENSEKDITAELTRFCQWRLLEAAHTDRWLYSAVEGAKERVKLR